MRLRALQAIFITAFLLSFPFSAGSQVQAASADAPTTDMGLCLPGIQDASENCLMAGPAARLQVLAEAGITFPEPQVFSSPTPIELANIPYIYGLVSNEEIPLYRSLEDIVNEEPSRTLIKSKIKYVSLIRKETTAMGEFYQIATDEWIKSELPLQRQPSLAAQEFPG